MEEEDFLQNKENKNIVIVLAIILIIAIIAVVSIFNAGFNMPSLPFVSNGPEQILVIGNLSLGERVVLDNLSEDFIYRERSAKDLEYAGIDSIKDYSIIILDQTLTSKSISAELGSSLIKYVEKGGNLVIVMNSAIKQSLGFNGAEANDSIGWKTNFGNLVPVECILLMGNEPSCKEGNEINVVGRILSEDIDHPIMFGIEVAPTLDKVPYVLRTLDVLAWNGAKTIASIKADNFTKIFPAIVEKKNFPFGKVIYFNYDPGFTPTIFRNTLNYLK